jgi:hypothetical protein
MERVTPEVSPLAGLVDKVEPEVLAYFLTDRKPEELAAFAAYKSRRNYAPEVQE